MSVKRLRVLLALGTASLFALAGCASSGSQSAEKVLVNAIGTNPPHFNRHLSTEIGTMVVGITIYETLVRLDAEYSPMPALAEEWSSNEEATEYTFKLREGIKWHDGEPFTSEDVKFTLERLLPLSPQGSAYAELISSVTTPDDYTVIVNFGTPFAPFVEALAGAWILPAHVFGDGQDIATHPANMNPVGTGPFKFDSFVSGDRVTVVRNPDYWGGEVAVDRIVFKIMPDPNSRILALESGEVDYIYASYVDKASYDRLKKNDALTFMQGLGGVSTVTAHVNTRNEMLSDPRVRRAIYQAIDREAVAEKAYYGYATPARGPIPAEMAWAVTDEVDFNKQLPYDPQKAEQLLDEAGYTSGNRGTIRLAYASEYATLASAAGVIKSNLEEIGVDVDLIAEDFQVWTERVYKQHDYDISLVFYTTFEDPSLGVARAYICNPDDLVAVNASGLCDPDLDDAFMAASQTTDRAKRAEAFAEAESRIRELLHTYPIVVEPQFSIGRQDRWNFEETHQSHPTAWGLVSAKQ